jgi:hypothetical protein
MNNLIDLCYELRKISSFRWYKPEAFVFRSVNDFTQIDALNGNHTVLFKIRVSNRDLGVWFKYPMIYQGRDADKKKLKLERLDFNVYYEKHYVDNVDKFNDIFDTEFDIANYKPFKQSIDFEFDSVGIKNNGILNVYSGELIDSVFLTDLEEFNLKITGEESPLKINYSYGIFDIYCLIAPRICDNFDSFIRV